MSINQNTNISRYKNLVKASFEGIIIVDESIIVDVNIQICELTDYIFEELINKNVLILFQEIDHSMILENLYSKEKNHFEIEIVTKNNELKFIEVYSKEIVYDDKLVKVLGIRELSDNRIYEKQLIQSEKYLKEIQKKSQIGRFKFDKSEKKIWICDFLRDMLKLRTNEIDLYQFINEIVEEGYRKSVNAQLNNIENFKVSSFKTNKINGHNLWLKIELIETYNLSNNYTGTIQNISDQIESELLIKHNYDFLEVLMDTIPHSIYYKDTKGIYIGCNKAFADFFDLEKEDIVGSNVFDLFNSEKSDVYWEKDFELFDIGGTQEYEAQIEDRDGIEHDVIFTKAVYYDLTGKIEGIVGVIADISEFKKTQEKLRIASITDNLTKLYNRVKLNEVIDEAIVRLIRSNKSLSVIMFDIDHFKLVNDNYGHHIGDEVLKTLAQIILRNVRDTDLVARWGGEEFMILLENTNLEGAIILAKKLRVAIEKYEFEDVSKITCSFGVTEYIKNETASDMFIRVDEALYRAKANGRNRVEY